eukprot:12910589-Prorocentrum_lima.AAC.1
MRGCGLEPPLRTAAEGTGVVGASAAPAEVDEDDLPLTDIAPKRASTGVVGAPPGTKVAVLVGAADPTPAPIT